MDAFDRNTIGYDSQKNTLRRICHMLKYTELYKSKGMTLPRGLLLEGEPGTGKSTMAECLIKESGRKAFLYRRDNNKDEFYNDIKEVFEKAKQAAPSVLLLDDMDKCSDQMSRSSAEWAAIQTQVDDCKDYDVFIIATVNDSTYIAQSLLRSGRFDYIVNVPIPQGDIAIKIMKHYLTGIELDKDVEVLDIAKALARKSCATLESVVHLAALNSVYDGSDKICKRHFIDAILEGVFQIGRTVTTDKRMLDQIAWHESAHALVTEVISPGKTSMVTIRQGNSGVEGMAATSDERYESKQQLLDSMAISLAGKACIEMKKAELDLGASDDLQKALKCAYAYVTRYGGCGISNVLSDEESNSDDAFNRTEMLAGAIMEQQYQRAREILGDHKDELMALHDALIDRDTLLNSDIRAIIGGKQENRMA